jgi:NADPH-dependent curcumin reductase CurA
VGAVGLTAYFGLTDAAAPRAGETLLVTGAAGAVGSMVGQIGKILGLRVIGIAGGAEKCRRLVEDYGFDVAIDYKGKAGRWTRSPPKSPPPRPMAWTSCSRTWAAT